MKISAFCPITNPITRNYPIIESIKSFLNIADEIIIIDGGSTDDSLEKIKEIGDNRIKIIQDKDTLWEDDWYYSRMGKNFNRGYEECTGDIIIKFDADYVVHESCYQNNKNNFRRNCEQMIGLKKLVLGFTRKNFIIKDSYFVKPLKTFGINYSECKKQGLKVKWGMDLEKFGWSYEPCVNCEEQNGIWFGDLLRTKQNTFIPSLNLFNYDGLFCSKEIIKNKRFKHIRAEIKQENLEYKDIRGFKKQYNFTSITKQEALDKYIDMMIGKYNGHYQVPMIEETHPELIKDKVKNLHPNQQGYDFWGIIKR